MLGQARCRVLTELGRPGEACRDSEAAQADLAEGGDTYARAWIANGLGRAFLLSGRLDEADRWFRQGAAGFKELSLPGNRRWSLFGSAWALALRGERSAATRVAHQARATNAGLTRMMEPECRRSEAAVLAAVGDRGRAARMLVLAADQAAGGGLTTLELGALHDLVRLGEVGYLDRLADVAARVDGVFAPLALSHAKALADGNGDGLGEVAWAYSEAGLRLHAAEAAAQASASHRTARRERAAAGWARRAREFDAPVGAAGSPALALLGEPVALTDREREVATMAAAGRASKEIAVELGVSRRTVDNHLHRAYTKLGVDGRDGVRELLLSND
jgi:DNA-binding CsgD family transcriptional regulator